MVLDEATDGIPDQLRGSLLVPAMPATMRPARSGMPMSTSGRRSSPRCAGVSDVINAVNFARANSLLVRGGGHNIPGNCV